MSRSTQIVVGSRRSPLAMWQTQSIISKMQACDWCEELDFVVNGITTFGDRHLEPILELDTTGVFTTDLERALLSGQIDMAVHSLKDMATAIPPGLRVSAVAERADYRDVLVSRRYDSLGALPKGARLGTGSPRRMAQLKRFRKDLQFVSIRGNIDSRLQKMIDMELDGLILAAAGLDRLGYSDLIRERISRDICLPAPGQGAICVETKEGGRNASVLAPALAHVNHEQTTLETSMERAFMARVGGGCSAAVGALAEVQGSGGTVSLYGVIARVDDGAASIGHLTGRTADASEIARELAEKLLKDGLHG